jgi:hypothetical protein
LNIILERVSVPGKAFITRYGIKHKVQHAMNVTEEELASLEVLEGEVLYSIDQDTLHTVKAPEVVTAIETEVVKEPTLAKKPSTSKTKTKVITNKTVSDPEV